VEPRLIAGRYELREPLGGSSWLATDTELERDVLVRLGPASPTGATPLSHPSIARVFDQGEAEGEPYVVREYAPGGSLAERGASSLSETDAQTAARDVAAVLAYAHGQGIAHGALTEENVLFDAEHRAKVADFAGVGEPQDDVRAFGGILQSLATAAPALAPVAAAALAGELDSAELVARLDDLAVPVPAAAEPTTLIVPPPQARPANRRSVVAAAAVAALLAAGIGAAFIATSGDSETNDPTTDSSTTSVPTGTSVSETTPPPPATTGETTEATTTGTTTASTSTAQTTEPPPATTAPPTTTEPPPETTEPPPETTEPPPTTTEEAPPPTTTELTTTEAG
jgi:serine/threonine protein kinase